MSSNISNIPLITQIETFYGIKKSFSKSEIYMLNVYG